jgi:hypothetical protein
MTGRLWKGRAVSSLLPATVLSAVFLWAAPARAGALPNLLDDNRGNLVLEATESALFTTAVSLLGFPIDPFILVPVPVILRGRTLNPSIHNLFWDSDWNAHNPDAPSSGRLDAFTASLAGGHYLDQAGEYGVGGASFSGSHGSSLFCLITNPGGSAEFIEILHWVSCEISFDPFSPLPGLFPAITGVPKADDNSLYVVYLPRETEVIEGGCDSFAAYHFFSAVPNTHIEIVPFPPFAIPIIEPQTFAFALVATKCNNPPLFDSIAQSATHEIVEAATDPIVGLGWINDTVVSQGDLLSHIFDLFNNINVDLRVGEAADICQQGGNMVDPPASQHPTAPVRLVASDPALGQGFITAASYWSNAFGACVPFVPVTTLSIGAPKFPAASASPFIASATQLDLVATEASGHGIASVSFRVFPGGTPPPDFTVAPGASTSFQVTGSDGSYTIEFFAQSADGVLEDTHTKTVVLDNTPPVLAIAQPTAGDYVHSAVLTLDYSANDGSGSGVASVTARLDGSTTLAGHGLDSGQAIPLLTELALGSHDFTVGAVDNLGNESAPATVTFAIIVTAESIKDDVHQFFDAGKIRNGGLANSLLAKLNAAASARARGNCKAAANIYEAFIHELEAQSGNGVDTTAAAIMIADAEYLIGHCP